MTSLAEAAKEILDQNVKKKQADQDPMPKSPAEEKDGGNSLSGKTPDALVGVPTATPPGKVANPNKDEIGVGKGKPKDADTIADYDFTQDTAPSIQDIINGVPAKQGKQTFDDNEGAVSPSGKTDLKDLFKGESVSPEFIAAAETLFEAAVNDKVNAIVAQMENELNEQYEKAVQDMYAELNEQADAYLNNFVNEWVEENRPVLESNIRSEIAESFMCKVKELFEEHNVQIDESNVDVVKGLSEQVEELTAQLEEAHQINEGLVAKIEQVNMNDIVAEACEGLTATQAQQLAMLSENITYNSIEDFSSKVNVIKESYILNGASKIVRASADQMLTEDVSVVEEDEKPHVTPEMRGYVDFLTAISKK